MKMNTKIIWVLVFATLLVSCEDALDKRDLGAIGQELVWNDEILAQAMVDRIYASNMYGWPTTSSSGSDNASGGSATLFGQLTQNSVNYWPYGQIRTMNVFFRDVGSGTLDESFQNELKGQVYFLRALRYFEMVKRYGGVPLILEPQELDAEDLLVSRNSTSECIAQIYADLDQAIALLPDKWSGGDVGRITKGGAMAYKARVALHYASEQFNPSQAGSRWSDALAVSQSALSYLEAQGYALHSDYRGLWFVEGNDNPEVVLARRYDFDVPGGSHSRDACTRPLSESINCTGANHPTLDFVRAFPMKNGLSIDDPASGYNPDAYWVDRDPRFDVNVAHNGEVWELSGKTGRIQWNFKQYTGDVAQTQTGWFTEKAVALEYARDKAQVSGVDWIEIRFAEVLLNHAEIANETGDQGLALGLLRRIRERAGIDAGADGNYGLGSGHSKAELRDVIIHERRLELAFEGKRSEDLRRRRLFAKLLNGKKKQGFDVSLTYDPDGNPATVNQAEFLEAWQSGQVNLEEDYSTYFTDTVKDLNPPEVIDYQDEYYFFAIPQSHLDANPNLEQNVGWGGSFDPLN